MLDVEALEVAGFEKAMTTEEWEKWCEEQRAQYVRSDGTSPALVTQDYVLRRDHVLIISEFNVSETEQSGLQTIVRYPEIVVIRTEDGFRRVTCAASDTELILELADQIAKPGR